MATVAEINAQRASRVAQGLDPYTGTKAGSVQANEAATQRSGGASGITQQGLTAPTGVSLSTPSQVAGAITSSMNGTETPTTVPNQAQVNPANTPTSPELRPTDTVPQDLANQVAQAEGAVDALKTKYTQAVADAKKAVPNAPANAGSANAGIQAAINGRGTTAVEPPSIIGSLQESDANFDSIFTQYDEYFSPVAQKTSLLEEYQNMSKSLGLDAINAELINEKRIIEGTEDDIRAEVTATGGFATESQVLALANARNKSLIKNYNYLLDSRNALTTQLSTYMELSVQDRKMAEDEFDRKLNFGFKVAEFKQKATDNARDTYLTLGEKAGWDTVLASASPYEQSLIGKTLGLSVPALQQLAVKSQEERALGVRKEEAEIANIYSQIGNRSDAGNSYGTIDGKPQNVNQSAANSYANRLNEADVVIASLGNKFTGALSMLPNFNFLKSGDRQAYEQAQNNFITAVLRRESGASIAPTEFDTARKTYFPQPGDKPETVAQKEAARTTVINNFYREANVNRPVLPGQVIESDGKRYKVGLDGETLETI